MRELRPAAVHPVEDVNYHVDRLVGPGHFLDVQFNVPNAQNVVEPANELALHIRELSKLPKPRDVLSEPRVPLSHEL